MATIVRKGHQYYGVFMVLSLVTAGIILHDQLASAQNISHFVASVEEASFTRLCETKNILTVNRKFPAPTIYARTGETLVMDVENKGNDNLTIFWREGRYLMMHERQLVWIIQPGTKVRQNVTISEQGTVWWHAMNIWQSATVHGAIVVYPMRRISYPYPKPHADIPIILGEWWKKDLKEVVLEYIASVSNIMHSDAFTINGQPGDFYPCSNNGTFKIAVETGKTYLLRIVNAAVGKTLVFGIAMHNLTVVAMDGRPIKIPFTSDYVELSVQQSLDCILEANQRPNHYYMAAREYVNGLIWQTYDNTTTTAILEYRGNYVPSSPPFLPFLPNSNYDTSLIHDKISSMSKLYLAIIFLILGLATFTYLVVWYRRHRCVITAVVTPIAEI